MRELTCLRCGRKWREPIRPGAVRLYCVEGGCSDERNVQRDLERMRDRGEFERAIQAELQRDARDLRLELAARPLRIAMALGLSSDLRTVAAAAGVDPDAPELAELVDEARQLFPGVVEGRPSEIQRVKQLAAGQAAVTVLFGAPQLSPAQAATAMKAIMQSAALEQSGGAGRTFSEIKIVLKGLEDEEDEA